MAHGLTLRSGEACNVTNDGLGHVGLDVLAGLLLGVAADLTDHHDRFGLRILLEHLQDIDEVGARDRVATDTDRRRLAQAQLGAALAFYGDQTRADAMFRRAQALSDEGREPTQGFRPDYGTLLRDRAVATLARLARLAAEQFAADSGSEVGVIRDANQGVISISDRDAATPDIKVVRVVSTIQYQLQ